MSTDSAELKQRVYDFLSVRKLMAMATYGTHLWIANVYYVVDPELNLYFISSPDSQHCRDILLKPTIVCSIFDSHQRVTDEKSGIQLRGVAEQMKDWERATDVIRLWNQTNPGLEEFITAEAMRKRKVDSLVYQIRPRLIKFFNEQIYGEEGFEVLKLNQ
jgi:uncharacterized protein YhbP (UPF0306 family)